MLKDKKGKSNNVEELLSTGYEIAGSATGGAIGCIVGGPSGAVVGAASGVVINKVLCKLGNEIKERVLSKREEVRIGATLTYAICKINENLSNNKKLREDDFFNYEIGLRSVAEEIYEGIILSAQREHEEKKMKFLGNLIANIPFDCTINRSKANFLIKIMEKLTYNQLCIIAIFKIEGRKDLNWGYSFNQYEELTTLNYLESAVEELDSLKIIGTIRSTGGTIITVSLSKFGEDLYNLASLEELDSNELLEIKQDFLKVSEIISMKK